MRIVRLTPGDDRLILEAAELFDAPPTQEWTARYLRSEGHHLLMAFEDEAAIGFVTGVEITHPDKGTEMLLYELSVHEDHRRKGAGKALTEALAALASEHGCNGMWVGTEADNEAALATYRSAGGGEPEPFVMISWTS